MHTNCSWKLFNISYNFLFYRYLEKFEAYENDPNFANYFHTSTSLPAVKAPPTAPHPHPLSHSFTASDLHTVQPSPASQSWTQQNVPKATTTSLSTIPTFQRPSVPGDSVSVGGGKECDKLVRSLLSGFPNEVDFALNVLTMMSFDKPSALPITKVTLYMYMYMHVQLYTCACTVLLVRSSTKCTMYIY